MRPAVRTEPELRPAHLPTQIRGPSGHALPSRPRATSCPSATPWGCASARVCWSALRDSPGTPAGPSFATQPADTVRVPWRRAKEGKLPLPRLSHRLASAGTAHAPGARTGDGPCGQSDGGPGQLSGLGVGEAGPPLCPPPLWGAGLHSGQGLRFRLKDDDLPPGVRSDVGRAGPQPPRPGD